MLVVPVTARAVLLDCEINPDKTYTCIEIGARTTTGAVEARETGYSEEFSNYIEQARSECVYNEPAKRSGNKNSSGTYRVEAIKRATAEYDSCVTERARSLWKQNQPASPAE
jgi:hypothetical protein